MIARLRASEFAVHGALVFGGVVVSAVFSYLFYIFISRMAGVETYGAVTALVSALLVFSAPATVAQFIVARLAADLEARGDWAAIRQLADTSSLWTGIVSAVVITIAVLARDAIAGFFNLTSSLPVVITALGLGFFAVTTVQRGVFQGSHRFGEYSASMSIEGTVKMIGVYLAMIAGVTGAMLGVLISQMVCVGYSLLAVRAKFGRVRGPLALDRALIVRVASNVGVAQITCTVLLFYDVPLIAHAFGAHDAGLYSAASLVGRALVAALLFVPTLLMPKVTAKVAAGQSPLPLFGLGLGLSALVVAIAIAAAAVAPRWLVTLLAGRAYAQAAPIILQYIVASGALALANVVIAYKIGLHRYDFVIPAALVAVTEIVVFAAWHPTLLAAVTVLLIGHVALLAVTLFGITAPLDIRDQSVNPAAAASL